MTVPRWLAVAAVLLAAGCQAQRPIASPTFPSTSTPGISPSTTPLAPVTRMPQPTVVEVRYRLLRHTTDLATAGFAATVTVTLSDPRGWVRAGFRFVRDDRARFVVVLGEAEEVQRRCLPYDVFHKYSCQNGPVVALNADRWRRATPTWTGTLSTYRQMLVNHEVGHLLGLHHPPGSSCPRRGRPAAVMTQQSTELNGCLPNPWPLPAEVARVARHDLPLAPPPS